MDIPAKAASAEDSTDYIVADAWHASS